MYKVQLTRLHYYLFFSIRQNKNVLSSKLREDTCGLGCVLLNMFYFSSEPRKNIFFQVYRYLKLNISQYRMYQFYQYKVLHTVVATYRIFNTLLSRIKNLAAKHLKPVLKINSLIIIISLLEKEQCLIVSQSSKPNTFTLHFSHSNIQQVPFFLSVIKRLHVQQIQIKNSNN